MSLRRGRWFWQLNSHPHIDEIGGESGFFVSADGGVVGGIDVETEFSEALRVCPGFEGGDDELVDSLPTVGRIDVHESAVGVVRVFEVVAGGVDAGIARADEGALEVGDRRPRESPPGGRARASPPRRR